MSSSKKRSSKKSPSSGGDFKRLKAKVGKRAPQRINATNTHVNVKSLKVAKQNGVLGYKQDTEKDTEKEGGKDTEKEDDEDKDEEKGNALMYRTVSR